MRITMPLNEIEELLKKGDFSPLFHEDVAVRWGAANCIVGTKDTRAFDHLMQALSDTDYTVRGAVVNALSVLCDRRAVPAIIKLLSESNETNHVRERCANALGIFGDERSLQPLLDALHCRNGSISYFAALSLVMLIKKDAFPHLLLALKSPTLPEMGIERAIASIGPAAIPLLAKAIVQGQVKHEQADYIVALIREEEGKHPKHAGIVSPSNPPDWAHRSLSPFTNLVPRVLQMRVKR